MSQVSPLAEHLVGDTINRLRRAANERHVDAKRLLEQNRVLAALYFFGYSVEMCLSAAYYRSAGFSPNVPIDRDTRQRRMAHARRLQMLTGEPLMNSDPHPLVGWARFLEWQRSASPELTMRDLQLLKEAVRKATVIYKHWRPELRYKTIGVTPKQLDEVHGAASWFIQHHEYL
jgi:hypothetical protein